MAGRRLRVFAGWGNVELIRIMDRLVRIIVRYSKLRKNYKNDSKVKIDGKGIMPYDGDIKQTGS